MSLNKRLTLEEQNMLFEQNKMYKKLTDDAMAGWRETLVKWKRSKSQWLLIALLNLGLGIVIGVVI